MQLFVRFLLVLDDLADTSDLVLKVSVHNLLDVVLVVVLEALEDLVVFIDQLLVVRVILNILITITLHLLSQIGDDVCKLWILRDLVDHIMESFIGLNNLTNIL